MLEKVNKYEPNLVLFHFLFCSVLFAFRYLICFVIRYISYIGNIKIKIGNNKKTKREEKLWRKNVGEYFKYMQLSINLFNYTGVEIRLKCIMVYHKIGKIWLMFLKVYRLDSQVEFLVPKWVSSLNR